MSSSIHEIGRSLGRYFQPESGDRTRAGAEVSRLALRDQFVVFAVGFLILVSRRPDAVLYPHFWGEDGKVWFLEAYQQGWFSALLQPHTGYYQTLSRLTASLALLLPLTLAPLLFNLVAIALRVLPVNLLVSSRFARLIPNPTTRLAMGFVYLGLPNSSEIHANLTNGHWHLAVLACMIVLAEPARAAVWRVVDGFVVALSALSGPFVFPLVFVTGVSWWRRPGRRPTVVLIIVVAGALIQGSAMLGMEATRSPAPLGATPVLFAEIVGAQVVLGSLVGERGYHVIDYLARSLLSASLDEGARRTGINLAAFALWVFVTTYAMCRARWEIRLLVLFTIGVLLGALATPGASVSEAQWPLMTMPGIGVRYWALPMVGFLLALHATVTTVKQRLARMAVTAALLLMPVGIALDWSYEPHKDLGFRERARAFENAPPNSEFRIPAHPNEFWYFTLKKK